MAVVLGAARSPPSRSSPSWPAPRPAGAAPPSRDPTTAAGYARATGWPARVTADGYVPDRTG